MGLIAPLVGLSFLDPLAGMAAIVGENALLTSPSRTDESTASSPPADLALVQDEATSPPVLAGITQEDESATSTEEGATLPGYVSVGNDLLDLAQEAATQFAANLENGSAPVGSTGESTSAATGSVSPESPLTEPPVVSYSSSVAGEPGEPTTLSPSRLRRGPIADLPPFDAIDDSYQVSATAPSSLPVTSNDLGGIIGITHVSQGAKGTVVAEGFSVIYFPNAGASGSDSFSYTIADAEGRFDSATVTLNLGGGGSDSEGGEEEEDEDDPDPGPGGDDPGGDDPGGDDPGGGEGENDFDAIDDIARCEVDSLVMVGVLSNDIGHDGSIVALGSASHGVASISGNQVSYVPDIGFEGRDQFAYQITDGQGHFDTAWVKVFVGEVNPAVEPLEAIDDEVTTKTGTGMSIRVLKNDIGHNGQIVSLTTPTFGSAVVQGSYVYYQPDFGYLGEDSFEYGITDGEGNFDIGRVDVTVDEYGLDAIDDAATVDLNQSVTLDVLVNDRGHTGEITDIELPQHGTLRIQGDQVVYTPTQGYLGADQFSYEITDGHGRYDYATVQVSVVPPSGTGAVGDFVWLDSNENGIQDSNEAGLEGVTVQLLDTTSFVIDETVTSSTGFYSFTGVSNQQDYRIAVHVPANLKPTAQGIAPDGIDSDIDMYGLSNYFRLPDSTPKTDLDAGFVNYQNTNPAIKIGFERWNNDKYDPKTDALGVSNWVTIEGLPMRVQTSFDLTSDDLKNFRIWVNDPTLAGQNASVKLKVEKPKVAEPMSDMDWETRGDENTYVLGHSKMGQTEVRSDFLRLVSDKFDDAASGHGSDRDPDKQTILVELGDRVTITYTVNGKDYQAQLKVGRPTSEDNNDPTKPWLHDIRIVKVNIVGFRNVDNNAPSATTDEIKSDVEVANQRYAQVGVRIVATNINNGVLGQGVDRPAGIANGYVVVDEVRGLRDSLEVNGKRSASEAAVLPMRDADKATIDVFYVQRYKTFPDSVYGGYRGAAYLASAARREDPNNYNFIIMSALSRDENTGSPQVLAHEFMHVLLDQGHDRRGQLTDPFEQEPNASLLLPGLVNFGLKVSSNKRIGPNAQSVVFVFSRKDEETIRENSETLPVRKK